MRWHIVRRSLSLLLVITLPVALPPGGRAHAAGDAASGGVTAAGSAAATASAAAAPGPNPSAPAPAGPDEALTVLVDDVPVEFDVAPRIENGRSLVPLRAAAEALGTSVEWNGETQTVTATDGKRRVRLKIGDPVIYRDDAPLPLDVPGRILDGRTIIPLRAFGEAFGVRVEWDDATRTARLWTPARPLDVLGYYALGDSKTSSWTELFGRPFPERDPAGTPAARLVSRVALGWFTLASGGELRTADDRTGYRRPDGWEDVLNAARSGGMTPEMMVFASDHDGSLTRWLLDAAAARRAARAIAVEAAAAPYAGVHLDLEGLGFEEQGAMLETVRAALTAFVRMVREELQTATAARPAEQRPTLTLALHPPNGVYQAYDYAALGSIADRVVLMAYDYGPRGQPEPLDRVQEAVRMALRSIGRDRLLLGTSAASEDAATIRGKVGVAKRYGLRGIALWRLGIVGAQRLDAIQGMVEPRAE